MTSIIKKLDLKSYYKKSNYYMNKPGLKGENVTLSLNKSQLVELIKCKNNIEYFLSNYVYIIHPDKGRVLFEPREFQIELMNLINENSNVMSMVARQSGKSIVIAGYSLHYIIFNSDKVVEIVSNKEKSAIKLLSKIKEMYKSLPMFMQHGVVEWNKTSILLDNGSKILVEATTGDAGTGDTVNLFICDEFAKVPKNMADDFMNSVLPTLSAGKSQKLVIITTPKGMNFFYRMWKKEERSMEPEYVLYKKDWKANPDRDEIWEKKERKKLKNGFAQEYECVSGDAIITVREEYTGYMFDIKIKELYKIIDCNNYRVLTPSGFEFFYKINKIEKNKYLKIIFGNNKSICCSENHIFINELNEEIKAIDMKENETRIQTPSGNTKVKSITKIKEYIELYDLVDVDNKSVYFTNGILSHNCSFLGSASSLISSDKLNNISIGDFIEKYNLGHENLRIYEKPIENVKYIITVDPAEGLGEIDGKNPDSSSFQILKIQGNNKFIQVGRFNDNTYNERDLAEIVNTIGQLYNNAYVLVEANNMGGTVLDILQFTYDYDNIIDLNKDRYLGGLVSTSKTNHTGNRILKQIIENDKLIIQDGDTIEQISNYSRGRNGTYHGIDGEHDDDVTSLRNFAYLISTEDWEILDDDFVKYSDILENEAKEKEEKEDIKRYNDNEIDDDMPFFIIK